MLAALSPRFFFVPDAGGAGCGEGDEAVDPDDEQRAELAQTRRLLSNRVGLRRDDHELELRGHALGTEPAHDRLDGRERIGREDDGENGTLAQGLIPL